MTIKIEICRYGKRNLKKFWREILSHAKTYVNFWDWSKVKKKLNSFMLVPWNAKTYNSLNFIMSFRLWILYLGIPWKVT